MQTRTRQLLIAGFALTTLYAGSVHAQAPAAGNIATIAGTQNGTSTSGDGGPALKATFNAQYLAADGQGDLYLSDINTTTSSGQANNEVRRIDASTHIITGITGSGYGTTSNYIMPRDLTVDSYGNVFVASNDSSASGCYIAEIASSTNQISSFQDVSCPLQTFTTDGTGSGYSAAAYYNSVTADASGNVYWSELIPLQNTSITVAPNPYTALIYRKSESTGVVTLLSGNPNSSTISGNGGPASQAGLGKVNMIRVTSSGDVYIASPDATIRMISASTGVINVVAGGGATNNSPTYQGPATGFYTGSINVIALDTSGHLYLGDTEVDSSGNPTESLIRRMDLNAGTISTVAGASSSPTAPPYASSTLASSVSGAAVALAADAQGNLYVSNGPYISEIGTPPAPTPPAQAAQQPQITSLSPNEGGPGGMVTITGVGFGATQGSSTVDFEGQPAPQITNVQWSDQQISFMIPQTQVNYAINGLVTVVNSIGASNAVAFTILPSGPAVTSILPDPGSIGQQVTIYGSNFGSTAGQSTITFGGVSATPVSWSPGAIVVTIPAGAATGNVVVDVTSNSSPAFLYLINAMCSPPS